jgi:hypothetical protein
VWERGTLPERGGMLPPEPGRQPSRSAELTCPFSPRPLHTAMYCHIALSVGVGEYRARGLIRRLRRPCEANSFPLCVHTLASSHGD